MMASDAGGLSDGEVVDHFAEIILESRFNGGTFNAPAHAGRYGKPNGPLRSCDSDSSDGFPVDAELASVSTFWANGNPVVIDISIRPPEDEGGRPGSAADSEVLLESWLLELTPLFSIEMARCKKACPPELDVSTGPPPEEARKLLARALQSFLHFSPVNSWLLKDPSARRRLRCGLREPCTAPAVRPLGETGRRRFEPLQLGQSQLLLESPWVRTLSGLAASSGSRALPHAHGRITDESPPRKATGRSAAAVFVRRTSSLDSSMLAMMASRRLLGSFEESLLSGRMSHSASSAVTGFMAEIGACGAGKTPKHITFDLPAAFYKLPGESSPSPYVGKIQLDDGHEQLPSGRYRVPTHGLVQVMIYNPERTGIKVFLVKYDFRNMPRRSRTFLRQRTFVESEDMDADGERRRRLLYAVHLRFVCTRVGRVYLHKDIRVVFTHRAPDPSEKIKTITEGPINPQYSPVKPPCPAGPGGKLRVLQRARHMSESDAVVGLDRLAGLELE